MSWGPEDEKNRYDLDFLNLNQNSIILDVGAYVGIWADKISKKYNCKVISYEPIEEYCDKIMNLGNSNIIVVRKALGISNDSETIVVAEDGSSIERYGRIVNEEFNRKYYIKKIEVINVDDELSKFDLIDVMKINTEGSEFELLNRLVETEYIKKIKYLQVQFHDFVDNANEMYEDIKSKLDHTHELLLDNRWFWSYWKIKSGELS